MARDLDRGRLLIPDPITVTLTRPDAPGRSGPASVTVAHVHEQAATEEVVDSPMGGSLDGVHKTFRLWKAECGPMEPGIGFYVTEADGTVWRIKQVDVLARGRQFRCHVVQSNEAS